jgi:predicted amidohydrolase YtcJ
VLAVGRRADLTVLSVDPFRLAAPADLLRNQVRLTVSRGRVTWAGGRE